MVIARCAEYGGIGVTTATPFSSQSVITFAAAGTAVQATANTIISERRLDDMRNLLRIFQERFLTGILQRRTSKLTTNPATPDDEHRFSDRRLPAAGAAAFHPAAPFTLAGGNDGIGGAP
jgi:hypothetical protein